MSLSWFDGLGQVGSYDAYMAAMDPEPALRYHRRILKLLQWKNPRKQWVLKDPLHLDRLAGLLKIYPDACFVWPHRDPVRALASVVSLIGTIQWGRTDHPFKGSSFEYVTDPEFSAQRFDAVIDLLETDAVPREQFCNIMFADLIADPIATVEGIYRSFNLQLSDAGRMGMQKYLDDNPRDARPPHQVSIGAGETVSRARQAYQRYQHYFNVPSE